MKKGQESVVGLFSLLMTGVLAGIVLPTMIPANAIKVTPHIDAIELENKAIILANSLMRNENLLYSNDGLHEIGIFDKTKLDSISSGVNSDTSKVGVHYPDTIALVTIEDKSIIAPTYSFYLKNDSSQRVKDFVSCMLVQTDQSYEACSKRFTSIFDRNSFPVNIRYPDGSVHIAMLKVTVIE